MALSHITKYTDLLVLICLSVRIIWIFTFIHVTISQTYLLRKKIDTFITSILFHVNLSLQTELTAYMFLSLKAVPALTNNLITLISAKPQTALSESL